MKLQLISCSWQTIKTGMEVLRQMESLKRINFYGGPDMSPDEFWKKYDAGEFK